MELKHVFEKALKGKYALGAFNFVSLDILKSIIFASEKTNAPVLACVSPSALNFIGADYLKNIIKATKKRKNNKVFFHLDHGKDFKTIKLAISLGFDSVMIDASSLPFSKNVELTKKVCDFAHEKGIFVEGEIGVLRGIEDDTIAMENIYTNPVQAKEFVEMTKVDSLAIAIGTSHGINKFIKTPKLNLDILLQIQSKLPNTPLVLHGASSVYKEDVEKFNKYGGKLKNAKGVPDEILEIVCQKFNICKVNTDTDIRICFLANLKESFSVNKEDIDIRNHIKYAREKTQELIEKKIHIFGL